MQRARTRIVTLVWCAAFICSCGGRGPAKSVATSSNSSRADASLADTGSSADAGGADMVIVPRDLGGPVSEPGGPEILELSVSPAQLTEGSTVTFSALLSDPDGLEDISGGQLTDRAGNVLGLFTGAGGAYTFTLSWTDVNANDPITFEDGETRVFVAEFVDTTNRRASQPLGVALQCDHGPACVGRCGVEECQGFCPAPGQFDNDPRNCGSCGRVCVDQFCEERDCVGCVPIQDQIGPCDPVCQEGCAANEACNIAIDATSGARTSVCVTPGSGTQGSDCASGSDCAAGFLCIGPFGGPLSCAQVCRLSIGTPDWFQCDDAQGLACSDIVDAGAGWGVCQPF